MSTSALRVFALAAIAGVSVTCADTSTGLRRAGLAGIALTPSFAQAPEGGPDIDVARVRGVLRGRTDSAVVEAAIIGDSGVLEFTGVPVSGDSTPYQLQVQAFDPASVVVFEAEERIQLKPGSNSPVTPVLEYVAPDATANAIDITQASVQLAWAGAIPNNLTCLNRAPNPAAVTQQQLTVTGRASGGQTLSGVRVGWTSRDTTVAVVDESGIVRARCSNKSTWIVARTFFDLADSVRVTVTAPPFSLLMSPDSANLARGATTQLTAILVDENGNAAPVSAVNWHSSNSARATVSSTGLVTGVTNGRVLITARSGDRTTVGVVHVVRPQAASVIAIPAVDTMAVGGSQVFFAKARDASNRIIGDATAFAWSSTNTARATVHASSGLVTAVAADTAPVGIVATIDGKADTVALLVSANLPGGAIAGRIVDAANDAPLAGVTLTAPAGSTTTDANGHFLLGNIQPGDAVTASLANYVTVTLHDAPVFRNFTLRIGTAGIPQQGVSGTLGGKVLNALNRGGISGITVLAYSGINGAPTPRRPNVAPVASTTSGSNGSYSFPGLPAGAYTLHFSGTGYSENLAVGTVVPGQSRFAGDVLLPPAAAGTGLVALLTWGASGTNVPADLDLHATGPDGSASGRFHVYTGSRAFVSGPDTIAALEIDRSNFVGPEVITLRASAAPGTYRLFVHNFSGRADTTSRALSDSALARVDVYQNNRVIATFFPPPGQQGTLWKVFEFDGARVRPVNAIGNPPDTTGNIMPMLVGDSDAVDLSRIAAAIGKLRKE